MSDSLTIWKAGKEISTVLGMVVTLFQIATSLIIIEINGLKNT